jgi:hypothetical protein
LSFAHHSRYAYKGECNITPEKTKSTVPNGHFSAKKLGTSTARWDERLRQTSAVLTVALKEFKEFSEDHAPA